MTQMHTVRPPLQYLEFYSLSSVLKWTWLFPGWPKTSWLVPNRILTTLPQKASLLFHQWGKLLTQLSVNFNFIKLHHTKNLLLLKLSLTFMFIFSDIDRIWRWNH